MIGGNADAGIADGNLHKVGSSRSSSTRMKFTATARAYCNYHGSAFRRKLEGVGQQIGNDLFQLVLVEIGDDGILRDFESQSNALAFRQRSEREHQAFEQADNVLRPR